MKKLTTLIDEHIGTPIDDQWLNDNKNVMTKDGRHVIITNIDYTSVPNVISGFIMVNNKKSEYKWNDDGTCIQAIDNLGNPIKPTDDDKLVKGK